MATLSFDSKLKGLQQETTVLELQVAISQTSLEGRQVSVAKVQDSHKQIYQVYQNIQNQIGLLKKEIHQNTTFSNQDQMMATIENVTDFETKAERLMIQFNDKVLTYYPTAKIEYGKACIGPRSAPAIETSNAKLRDLLAKSSSIRPIRGDGNCFVSAFATRFLETLVKEKAVDSFISFLTSDGIKDSDLKESLIDTLLYLNEYPSQIDQVLQNNEKMLPFINYFRQLTAHEMKTNAEHYEAFFLSDINDVFKEHTEKQSYGNLVDKYVLSMGTDFSHPAIVALCTRLQFPVVIVDSKIGAADGLNILEQQAAKGTFCRHGEHYFVLYTKEEATPIAPQQPIPQLPVQQPTEIVVKCQVPFGHNLFIRGSESPLSWEKGIPLIQIDEQTWIFRSSVPLEDMEYKFLFDDAIWAKGNNHKISQGKLDVANPEFDIPSSANLQLDLDAPTPVRTTRITVKYDAGLGNKLTIQGTGPGMSWGKGTEMKNIGNDIWIWESQTNFENFEFKILLNDIKYQIGLNNKIDCGKKEEIVPNFPL